MARTKRDIKYSNPNARKLRHRSERVNQEVFIQEMKEAGFQSFVRPRDKAPVQNPFDDYGVAAYGEIYNPHTYF